MTPFVYLFICAHISQQGDILLVAEDYDDGWMRGLRLKDMAVSELKMEERATDKIGVTGLGLG